MPLTNAYSARKREERKINKKKNYFMEHLDIIHIHNLEVKYFQGFSNTRKWMLLIDIFFIKSVRFFFFSFFRIVLNIVSICTKFISILIYRLNKENERDEIYLSLFFQSNDKFKIEINFCTYLFFYFSIQKRNKERQEKKLRNERKKSKSKKSNNKIK